MCERIIDFVLGTYLKFSWQWRFKRLFIVFCSNYNTFLLVFSIRTFINKIICTKIQENYIAFSFLVCKIMQLFFVQHHSMLFTINRSSLLIFHYLLHLSVQIENHFLAKTLETSSQTLSNSWPPTRNTVKHILLLEFLNYFTCWPILMYTSIAWRPVAKSTNSVTQCY